MMTPKTYKVTSKKLTGHLLLTYNEGGLITLLWAFSDPLTPQQWHSLKANIPSLESDLHLLSTIGLTCVIQDPEADLTLHERIKLWAVFYKEFKKASYDFTSKDKRLLKEISVTSELLKAYFICDEWWCKQKDVANYYSYINRVKVLLSNNGSTVSEFPEQWDIDFSRSLTPEKRKQYFKYLSSRGWIQKKEGNTIIGWMKP